ncbi:hypothetical protein [Vibrio metschnikovii]|uniref:hypothetical protein n=1 Tax=Vibrio metschnikovii TaxID=28172 RepID=UPI001C301FFA|nr:hypothetical protein [Vibrio metschnikovii]
MFLTIPKWCTLRLIGSSKVVKLTIIMPFLGYLILFNNEIIIYFELSKSALGIDSAVIEAVSFNRLYQLYFGLMIVGLASLLFSLFCPQIIKTNADEYSYYEKELFSMTEKHLITKCDMLNKSISEMEQSNLRKVIDCYNNASTDAENKRAHSVITREQIYSVTENNKKEAISDALKVEWLFRTNSMPKLRLIISIFYGVGFAILIYPSANIFLKVCSIVWGQFWG